LVAALIMLFRFCTPNSTVAGKVRVPLLYWRPQELFQRGQTILWGTNLKLMALGLTKVLKSTIELLKGHYVSMF